MQTSKSLKYAVVGAVAFFAFGPLANVLSGPMGGSAVLVAIAVTGWVAFGLFKSPETLFAGAAPTGILVATYATKVTSDVTNANAAIVIAAAVLLYFGGAATLRR